MKNKLVMGVIGADVHAVGNKILYHAFTKTGFEAVNLGVMVLQEEYIDAAIETGATPSSCRPCTATESWIAGACVRSAMRRA